MNLMKHLKMSGLYLVGLCLLSVFAFGGAAGSAAAASLLFRPESGVFPYHFVGSSGASKLEMAGGSTIVFPASHYLVLVLSATTADVHVLFLETRNGTEPCGNIPNAASGKILENLFGHLGLAHPGDVPAVLGLFSGGSLEFKCLELGGLVEAPIKVRGNTIGRIVSPALGVSSETLLLSLKQTAGKQEFTTFLKGNEILTGQHAETSINGGAFEESGQEGHGTLKVLVGQGTFLLVSP